MPRIVTLSDTHRLHRQIAVPDGDIVIHAGDSTGHGSLADLEDFLVWFRDLPHKHKVLIAGNHDFCFDTAIHAPRRRRSAMDQPAPGGSGQALVEKIGGVTYLQDQGEMIEGLSIWGSPWQPWFYDWAFNLARGPQLAEKWAMIPNGIDIVVTHGPPMGILDRTDRGEHVGCADLRDRMAILRPRLHVFGHIHEGYGKVVKQVWRRDDPTVSDDTIYVNAANCTVQYRVENPPIVVDLEA